MSGTHMRGLTQFIGDIRNCANKEEERKRVDKEMANIRKHFKTAVKLTPYQKRKYVWKMLYIYVLGYDVDFGHMEALNLITNQGYAEKTVGYLACVLLLSETNEFLRLVINSVKNDLNSHNEEIQSLALACVANVGGREFAETLAADVEKIVVSSSAKKQCRKKAALCLLRLVRKYPEGLEDLTDDFKEKLMDLLEDPALGVVTASLSLLIGLVSNSPHQWSDKIVHKACKLLSKLNHTNAAAEYGAEYVYYKTICPWLQIKILRLLQYYPPPDRDDTYSKLCQTLSKLISDVTMVKSGRDSVNINNSAHAVLFEAVNYVIHMENNKELISAAVNVLGQRMSASNQSNYRYLALDAMQRMAHIEEAAQQFKKHQDSIIKSLKDKDVSLRRRALDVLYSMCDSHNSELVVGQLLEYLEDAGEALIREELVLRVAILAERFSPNLQWYVDTILKLIALAGDYVSNQIWMRVVQIVTNNEDLQLYAAETSLRALKSEAVHESMVKCGGYIVGEFGHLMVNKRKSSARAQWTVLRDKFHLAEEAETKQVLLTSFVKLINAHPELKGEITELIAKQTTTIDVELQQRAVEYLALAQPGREHMLETVMDMMPNFPDRESILTRKIKERDAATTDRTLKQIQTQESRHEGEETKEVDLQLSASAVKVAASKVRAPAAHASAPQGDLLHLDTPQPPAQAAPVTGPAGRDGSLQPGMLDDLLGGPPPSSLPSSSGGGALDDLLSGAASGAGGAAATMPAAAAGAGKASMMDDLLGLGAAPSATTHAGVSLDDLLGGGGASMSSTMPAGHPPTSATHSSAAATPFEAGAARRELSGLGPVYKAALANKGVIFESQGLRVQAEVALQGNVARVLLRFCNTSGGALEGFKTVVQQIPQVLSQAQPLATSSIPPGGVVEQQVQLKANDYFVEPPKLAVAYMAQGAQKQMATWIPVHVAKFNAPVQCNKDQYFAVWGKISGPPNECVKLWKSQAPINRAAIEAVVKGLNFSVLQGVDPNDNNVVGAAKVHLGPADVYSVLRIETEPIQLAVKLTIKTSNASMTEACRAAVMLALDAGA